MQGRAIALALTATLGWPVAGFAALIVDPAQPITNRVTVQIIETALRDGTSPATIFGSASRRAAIEAGIGAIWAQASIDTMACRGVSVHIAGTSSDPSRTYSWHVRAGQSYASAGVEDAPVC